MTRRRVCIAALSALLLGLCVPVGPAHADGDPPSDVLILQDVYYGYGLDLESKPAAQLPAMLAAASQHGYPLRVALMTNPLDLGAVGWLWQKPQQYARYLGDELALQYKGAVLIVMPHGYGIYRAGTLPGRERRLLARSAPPRGVADFLPTAIAVVQRLAGANGVRLNVPDVTPPPGGVPRIVPHSQAAGSPTVAPRTTTTSPAPAQAAARRSANWLFLAPVAALVGAAVLSLAVGRLRRRRRT